MIRVSRGPEPEPKELRRARYENLPLIRAKRARGEALDRKTDCVDYRAGKARLHQTQYGRCAYCERPKDVGESELEHFRPWASYWWLAWTWTNHLVACKRCNRKKGDHFELTDEAARATEEGDALDGEAPRFVDPAAEDPLAHIRFVRVAGKWTVVARNGCPRGQYTIDKLGLRTLGDRYQRYWIGEIAGRVRDVRAAISAGETQRVHRLWSGALRRLFHPEAKFQALAYDALDAEFRRRCAPAGASTCPDRAPRPIRCTPSRSSMSCLPRPARRCMSSGRMSPIRWALRSWHCVASGRCHTPICRATSAARLARSESTFVRWWRPAACAAGAAGEAMSSRRCSRRAEGRQEQPAGSAALSRRLDGLDR